MDTLTVNVPDEKQAIAVDSWEDGMEYDLRVKQTGAGAFDLVSAESVDEEIEIEAEETPSEKKKSPARFAVLIGK